MNDLTQNEKSDLGFWDPLTFNHFQPFYNVYKRFLTFIKLYNWPIHGENKQQVTWTEL